MSGQEQQTAEARRQDRRERRSKIDPARLMAVAEHPSRLDGIETMARDIACDPESGHDTRILAAGVVAMTRLVARQDRELQRLRGQTRRIGRF